MKMPWKIAFGFCVCLMAGGHGLGVTRAHAERANIPGEMQVAQNTDRGTNNTQSRYRAPGDHSIVRQHFGPASRNSRQTAVSASPGQHPNTIVQSSDGGNGNSQTAIVTGGGGNTVIQSQTGSHNRQVVTQTGSGNRAVQIQRGTGKTSVLNQRGHESGAVVQEQADP